MINLVYPDNSYDTEKYNNKERTFSGNNIYWNWTFEWLLHRCEIPYSQSTNVKQNQNNFLLCNIYNPTTYEDFYSLPEEYIGLLENNNTYLLLYQATECNCYYWLKDQWANFYKYLAEKQISPEKIFFITGDLYAEKNHIKFNHEYFSRINVCSIEIWEIIHYSRIEYKELPSLLDSIDNYSQSNKEYDFISLNATVRPNKQALLYYLNKNNLIDKNAVSCLWQHNKRIATKELFKDFCFDNSTYIDFTDFIGTFKKDMFDSDTFLSPLELYAKSKYSLVAETHTLDNILFFSEKIYKPLALGHPFCVFGTAHTLAHIKKNGYETFDELFDESYDVEESKSARLEKIINISKQDVDISNITIQKLKHNQQQFLKQKTRLKLRDKLIEFLS